MSKRKFTGRRFSANKAQTLWVTDVNSLTLGATNEILSFVICAGSNWERANLSAERATVLAVKGYLYAHHADATASTGTSRFSAMIAIADEDAPAPAALGSSVIDAESAMWAYHTGIGITGAEEQPNNGFIQNAMVMDIKAKRKLTNGQGVDLTVRYEVQSGAGNIMRVGWMLRTLIKIA